MLKQHGIYDIIYNISKQTIKGYGCKMGFVGFTYLIIFLVILYYVILLAILAGGFALFYYGLRSHRKPENEKKVWPIILKISGIAIMAFMLVAIVTNAVQIARKVNDLASPDHYELPEQTSSIDTVQQMLRLADENDRDQFRSMFSESYRNSDLFDDSVEEFFTYYPQGLSACELQEMSSNAYTCELDGETYYINIHINQNDYSSENNGVTLFGIENDEAKESSAFGHSYMSIYCNIIPAPDTHRLIDGETMGYMFTPERELTLDDFAEFLSEGMTVSDITEHFGKPNSTKIVNDSRKAFYYSIDNDELGYPRYVCLECARGGKVFNCRVVGDHTRKDEYVIWRYDFNNMQ